MKLTLTDGRVLEASDPKPFDIVAFERKYKQSAAHLSKESPLEHAFFLAYSALRRTGEYTGDFEQFLADLDDYESDEGDEDEEEAGPLDESTPPTSKS